MSSLMGSDIHELFVHLIRIKDVYNQIISRYYLVSPGFKEKALIDKFITLNKYKNFKKSIKRKYQTYHIYRRPQLNPYLKLKVKDMRENELLTLKRKKYKNSIKELERDAKIFNNIIKDFKESKDLNERLANIFL